MQPKSHLRRARTVEEYVEMINQAIFETEELRMAIEYDEEGMGSAVKFVSELEDMVKGVRKQMEAGEYVFATGDLPFMTIVNEQDDRCLPFKYILRVINETHLKGLDVETH